MKLLLRIVTIFILINCFSYKSDAQSTSVNDAQTIENKTFPKATGYINDFSKIFTDSQIVILSKIVNEYKNQTSREIAIVTIDSISPLEGAFEYAVAIGNYWGVGKNGKDNGLIIVVCKPCRQIGIATGAATEEILTDEFCGNVIHNNIIPEFKKGDIYKGIIIGLKELINEWNKK